MKEIKNSSVCNRNQNHEFKCNRKSNLDRGAEITRLNNEFRRIAVGFPEPNRFCLVKGATAQSWS
jgi:hypothetical protein